jgi:uncharacterized damage-inducible protein DinB
MTATNLNQPQVPTQAPAENQPEPWLRGTLAEVDPVARAVLHALELAEEDIARWCSTLTGAELNARPYNLPPVGFHLRHIARSLDRLLTYAEGAQLDAAQKAALRTELDAGATLAAVMDELHAALRASAARIRAFTPETYNHPRGVGRAALPTTVAGLLVHCADHTQRHTGQAIATAKLLVATRAR